MGDDHKMKGGKSQAPTVHIKKFFAQAKKQVAAAAAEKKPVKKSSRLYVKGVVAGFRRALTNQKSHTSLMKIMYMYRTKTVQGENGSRFKVMWGKVCGAHGTSGTVRCKFRKNLPPSAICSPVRVMLFPCRV